MCFLNKNVYVSFELITGLADRMLDGGANFGSRFIYSTDILKIMIFLHHA